MIKIYQKYVSKANKNTSRSAFSVYNIVTKKQTPMQHYCKNGHHIISETQAFFP